MHVEIAKNAFEIEPGSGGARVFSFELQLQSATGPESHWIQVDGVLLPNGEVLLNKLPLIQHVAQRAGLEPAAMAAHLREWVAGRTSLSAAA